MPQVELWFEFASTYSYIAVRTAGERAHAAGVHLTLRPFLLGPLFREQGLLDSPFNLNPVKGAYMWRDMQRECDRQGLAFRRPSVFPRNGLLAARVATAADGEPWQAAFASQVFTANFADDLDIAAPEVLHQVLEFVGVPDAGTVLERADDPIVKQKLRDRTAFAWRSGIFGAPTFRVGDELFWGSDRMEQAFAWALAAG